MPSTPASPDSLPLVSVIVRTLGRAELSQALDSIAAQDYPAIEVVVVDASGTGTLLLPPACGAFRLRVVNEGHRLIRSRAANAGMAQASGAYLIFLDDDDIFYPQHISALVATLQQHPQYRAAYAGVLVRHFYPDGTEGPQVVLNTPFERLRLPLENHIPIHAMLFARNLYEAGCCFDESLDRYEDWDFWLCLLQHTDFAHVDQVSACYHNTGASGFGIEPDLAVIAQSRAAFFDKWRLQWSGAQWAEMLDYAWQRSPRIRDLEQHLSQTQAHATGLEQALTQAQEQARQERLEHLRLQAAFRAERAGYQAELARLGQQLQQSAWALAQAQNHISALYASSSWRLTKPLRALKQLGQNGQRVWVQAQRIALGQGGLLKGSGWLLKKTAKVLYRHGFTGLLRRVQLHLSHPASNTPAVPITPPCQHTTSVTRLNEDVAIIVCIHNALEDVKRCLSSVLHYSSPPYQLILVNDGSEAETSQYLRRFAQAHGAMLLENQQAQGYTLAANQGLRATHQAFVILLNSDTIVSRHWLERMLACAVASPAIGLVGPLSNTASWQSIPEIFNADGDWANNPLPDDLSVAAMADRVAHAAKRIYPHIGFLNGFCLLIKRAVIEQIGLFDESHFAQGYGEENDYCLRARQAGFALAVADDVYIYHAQSKSYSTARRRELAARADQILAQKHDAAQIADGVHRCQHDPVWLGVRARMQTLAARHAQLHQGRRDFEGRRVLFILPVLDAGGGGNIIINEAQALIRMGVDAQLLNLERHREHFTRQHPYLSVPVIYAEDEHNLAPYCADFDAVIATVFFTVPWIATCAKQVKPPILGYYIQDFEPYFFPAGSAQYQEALASYQQPLRRFCKTAWNQEMLHTHAGADCTVIGPSLNVDLYYPRPRQQPCWPAGPLRISAMIRPTTPRRAPEKTLRILQKIAKRYGKAVEIVLFGENPEHAIFADLPPAQPWHCVGKQTACEMAQLFSESDIFVDFSDYQAMGLAALEAMACATAVIVPAQGGALSYARDQDNALVVDTQDEAACTKALIQLIEDSALRTRLTERALQDAAQYFPEQVACAMLETLFKRT